jgi:hypothetical protein
VQHKKIWLKLEIVMTEQAQPQQKRDRIAEVLNSWPAAIVAFSLGGITDLWMEWPIHHPYLSCQN